MMPLRSHQALDVFLVIRIPAFLVHFQLLLADRLGDAGRFRARERRASDQTDEKMHQQTRQFHSERFRAK